MRRWRIGAIGKTNVYVHPAIIISTAYAICVGNDSLMAMATLSIILHEAAHALASYALGNPPSSLELTPLGAMMQLESESVLPPWKRCLVLFAGPVSNVLMCWLAMWTGKNEIFPIELSQTLFLCNLSILMINMLPVLPLDGGRLLALLLSMYLHRRTVYKTMRVIGTIAGAGLILMNLWCCMKLGGWNLSLAFSGCCVLYSAAVSTTTQAMQELRFFLDRKIRLEKRGRIQTKIVTAVSTLEISAILQDLPETSMIGVCCLELGTQRMLGWITEPELIQLYMKNPCAKLGDHLNKKQNM